MNASHTIDTPSNAVGAVSVISVRSDDLDAVFDVLKMSPMRVGEISLRSVLGLDDALFARFDERTLMLMPHGGIGNTRVISEALVNVGITIRKETDLLSKYPEAEDIHDARMLEALSRSPSPLAVDVLLGQPALWRAVSDEETVERSSTLMHLINPPLVVAVGRANIGKSSLVNALAGSSVAMVSDHAGTTRDHLGVMLDLAGLVVRWVDTPGIDERVEVGDELSVLEPVIQRADLVVHAIDHDDADGALDPRLSAHIADQTPIIRIGMRCDLGGSKCSTDYHCSVKSGEGIDGVVRGIRDRLIDPAELSTPKAWRFW